VAGASDYGTGGSGVTEEEREALNKAIRGDYSALNHLEYQAAGKKVEIQTEAVSLHGFYVEEYEINGALFSGTGRLCGLRWRAGSYCEECGGFGEAWLHGTAGWYLIDCPACDATDDGEDEVAEVFTDMGGNLLCSEDNTDTRQETAA